MNIFNKYLKGQYEYASYNKKRTAAFTVGMYALSAALYIIGIISTGSNKNLLTIVAVLGVLPASKLLISLVMSLRVKATDFDTKNEIDLNIGELNGLFHMYFTSYDINFYLVHCVVTADSFIGYADDKDFDEKKFIEHIEKHMKIDGISDVLIKVFTNKDTYINRLKQLNEIGNTKTNTKVFELINNISL